MDYLVRQSVNLSLELAAVLHNVFGGLGLSGKAHIHNRGWVALGGRKIYEPALAYQIDGLLR